MSDAHRPSTRHLTKSSRQLPTLPIRQLLDGEWVCFPGCELEGTRSKALCPACREAVRRQAAGRAEVHRRRTLCFQCYRAEIERMRAILAAGRLDTASEARFQCGLPFEPVDAHRLARL